MKSSCKAQKITQVIANAVEPAEEDVESAEESTMEHEQIVPDSYKIRCYGGGYVQRKGQDGVVEPPEYSSVSEDDSYFLNLSVNSLHISVDTSPLG